VTRYGSRFYRPPRSPMPLVPLYLAPSERIELSRRVSKTQVRIHWRGRCFLIVKKQGEPLRGPIIPDLGIFELFRARKIQEGKTFRFFPLLGFFLPDRFSYLGLRQREFYYRDRPLVRTSRGQILGE